MSFGLVIHLNANNCWYLYNHNNVHDHVSWACTNITSGPDRAHEQAMPGNCFLMASVLKVTIFWEFA